MNPTTWFSSREPDASMIAGRAGAPDLPTSPALNHTPTALAHNYGATGGSPANSSLASSPASTNGSQPVFGNQPATGTFPQSAGLAARSNGFQTGANSPGGYQTGPYGMSPTATEGSSGVGPVATASAMANTAVSSPNVNSANPVTGAFPSPYGGSYGPHSGPSIGTAVNSVADVGVQAPFGAPAATVGTSAPSWNMPDYPSLPTSPVSATQVSVPMGGVGSVPQNQLGASLPVNANQPAPSAYQSAPPSGAFAPGTTARNTNYNFGTSSSGGQAPPSTGLPPNTATGNSPWLR